MVALLLLSLLLSGSPSHSNAVTNYEARQTIDLHGTSVEHKVLDQKGYSIHYFISGNKTGELIIFLHPAFADHRSFDNQVSFFSHEYRVITLDMLGHGLSKVGKSKDKIDCTVEHIDSIMKIEGYTKAHIVGVSAGSLLAQYFALQYPQKVLSLTVLGGFNINEKNREISKSQHIEKVELAFKALFSMNSFRKEVSRTNVTSLEEQKKYYEMSSLFTRKSFKAMSGMGKILKNREDVKHEYPLMIMVGEKDINLAHNINNQWHEEDPDAKYCIIEGAGHCANMDNPDEFNKTLLKFLKKEN
ncbi:MAG TPA: alpha/beta hydrolase [Bacteroidales bacterium]